MDYEWDLFKALDNVNKHGVDFADAVLALEDERALTMLDPDVRSENRYLSLGMDANGRILVTVFTLRGGNVRIISSRRASAGERRRYRSDT